MQQYLAKPFPVEAVQWAPGVESAHVCTGTCETVGLGADLGKPHVHHSNNHEIVHVLEDGDYIVKNGHLVFGLSKDQFEAAYAPEKPAVSTGLIRNEPLEETSFPRFELRDTDVACMCGATRAEAGADKHYAGCPFVQDSIRRGVELDEAHFKATENAAVVEPTPFEGRDFSRFDRAFADGVTVVEDVPELPAEQRVELLLLENYQLRNEKKRMSDKLVVLVNRVATYQTQAAQMNEDLMGQKIRVKELEEALLEIHQKLILSLRELNGRKIVGDQLNDQEALVQQLAYSEEIRKHGRKFPE